MAVLRRRRRPGGRPLRHRRTSTSARGPDGRLRGDDLLRRGAGRPTARTTTGSRSRSRSGRGRTDDGESAPFTAPEQLRGGGRAEPPRAGRECARRGRTCGCSDRGHWPTTSASGRAAGRRPGAAHRRVGGDAASSRGGARDHRRGQRAEPVRRGCAAPGLRRAGRALRRARIAFVGYSRDRRRPQGGRPMSGLGARRTPRWPTWPRSHGATPPGPDRLDPRPGTARAGHPRYRRPRPPQENLAARDAGTHRGRPLRSAGARH